MCMRMNVSLRMVHLRRDAWHASVCRNRALEPEPFYGEYCGSGVRCTVVTGCGKGTLGRALFTLSYDIVHVVAQKSSSHWWNVWIDAILLFFPIKRFDVVRGSSSDEEGEHTLENIMLCSFAHHACRPFLQGFIHEAKLWKVALTCPL